MAIKKTIWTIGHSTRSIDDFIDLLKAHDIELLIDIRLLPGSKRYPQFNKDELEKALSLNNIGYCHMKELGGRRKPRTDSKNTAWRIEAFKGYADYMETGTFKQAIHQLEEMATLKRTVYMCAEAVWWSCHRALVSDYLKVRGWKVLHILTKEKAGEHPYTKPARIVNGKLDYGSTDLFSLPDDIHSI